MTPEDLVQSAVQRYCVSVAKDRMLVQAAGGNVSWKSSDTIWIKASGTWLAEAEQKQIFVPVERQSIDTAIASGDFDVTPVVPKGYELRPSIETLLHALMPQRFVVHLHPVDAVVHLTRRESHNELVAALGNEFCWDLVNYHKPGAELAKAINAKLEAKPDVQVLLLTNHGVILGAETIDEIDVNLKILCQRLRNQPRIIEDDPTLGEPELLGTDYRVCKDVELQKLAIDKELYQRIGDCWAICPDHVVFLGAQGHRVDDLSGLPDALRGLDPAPPFVFVKGCAVLENRAVTLAQKAQLKFYFDVMVRQPRGERLKPLSRQNISSLLNWEAEKYRQSLNRLTL